MSQFPTFGLVQIFSGDPTAGAGVSGLPNEFLIRTDVPSLYYKSGAANTSWTSLGNGGGSGTPIQTVSERLLVEASSVAIPPVYSTLMSASLTSTVGTFLEVTFTAAPRHSGATLTNVAINFRFRLNGTLVAPGGGTTVNMVRDVIQSASYSLRVPITAGVQTVDVEWAGFGLGLNTMFISALLLPDLQHAQLILQEQI